MRIDLVVSAIALAFAVSASAQQSHSVSAPTPSPEQEQLGQVYAVLIGSTDGSLLTSKAMLKIQIGIFDSIWGWGLSGGVTPLNGPSPDLSVDLVQVRRSIEKGVASIAPRLSVAIGDVYARAFDADTLRAAIAFYGSPAERAKAARQRELIREIEAVSDKSLQQMADGLRGGVPGQPSFPTTWPSGEGQAKSAFERSTELNDLDKDTPAESTFNKTLAGKSLASRAQRTEAELDAAMQMLWAEAISVATDDYCRVKPCGAGIREIFRHLALLYVPSNFTEQPEHHALGGEFAEDFFPAAADADLARAACAGDAAGILAAKKAGANPNFVGKLGSPSGGRLESVTPLIWAMDCNSLAGMDALISAGADPNLRGAFGQTAIFVAAGLSDPAPLELLLRRGGDPNSHDNQGNSAISEEMTFGHSGAGVAAFLDAGLDMNRQDSDGDTIADQAAMDRSYEALAVMLERGYRGDLSKIAGYLSPFPCNPGADERPGWQKVTQVMKSRGHPIQSDCRR